MNSAAIPDNRKRKIFGYVEQSFHMVPGTIKDQITLYDKSISDEAVIKAAKLTGLHDTIMNFEMDMIPSVHRKCSRRDNGSCYP